MTPRTACGAPSDPGGLVSNYILFVAAAVSLAHDQALGDPDTDPGRRLGARSTRDRRYPSDDSPRYR